MESKTNLFSKSKNKNLSDLQRQTFPLVIFSTTNPFNLNLILNKIYVYCLYILYSQKDTGMIPFKKKYRK